MRTGTTSPPSGGSFSPVAPFVQPEPPKARRQPAVLALGIALIGASAVGFVFWNHQSSTKTPVLVVARDVPYGQQLTAADLKISDVALGPGVAAIGSGSMSKALAEVATTDLHAGALLTPADISTAPPLPPGTDLISFSVKTDAMPTGLTTGRTVLLVANKVFKSSLSDPGSSAKAPAADSYPVDPPTYKVTVVAISGTKLSVAIPAADAVVAQELGADGRFGIVLLPAGS